MTDREVWTDADFDRMSWHDNHVHGLSIRAGEYGAGELTLDLDYILEWRCTPHGSCDFRVAPATLTFHETTDLKIEIDYASLTAALTPFSISEITRKSSTGAGGRHSRWSIAINWPQGSISFAANGFTQVLRGDAVVTSEQWLDR
jgi:hypothetical protein